MPIAIRLITRQVGDPSGDFSRAASVGSALLGLLLYAILAEVCLFGGCIWPNHP